MAKKAMGRRIAVELFLAILIGALLGMMGPFGSYRMDAGPRLAFWIFMIVAGLMIFRPTIVVSDWLAAETGLPGWAARGLAIAIGSLPMAVLVAWSMNGYDLWRALQLPYLPLVYSNVFLISALTNAVYWAVFRERDQTEPLPQTVGELNVSPTRSVNTPAFQSRLSPGFGQLIALSSEDHYVRAHSVAGSELMLIRLRDAIAELDPALEGMQVHRSWWVARNAVASHKTTDRALRLVLTNGLEVPVARDRIAPLKAAGWVKP